MAPVAVYLQARINIADLVALLVALIPTTIGALLSAIGIAGIDRTFRFNMLAMSGKAVEAAGDVHTLLLDKTGTITVGDRQATEFLPLAGCTASDLVQAAYLSSCFDTTPEGRTIMTLGERQGATPEPLPDGARPLEFSAETRMSGVDLPDGRVIRKGAVSAVVKYVAETFGGRRTAGSQRDRQQRIAEGWQRRWWLRWTDTFLEWLRSRTCLSPAFTSVCCACGKWESVR